MVKFIAIGIIGLIVGLLIGIFVGRAMMEREWSTPNVLKRLSATDAGRSSGKGADPAPKEGTLVVGAAPFARARAVLADVTSKDPVVLKVGTVGNTDEGQELHIVLKNRGKCQVTAVSGVAYGYDAYGHAVKMNQGGEHYVAFSEDKVEDLDVGKDHMLAMMLHNVDTASLALAQVDQVTCANGEKWARN
jgi:hypothetical protein